MSSVATSIVEEETYLLTVVRYIVLNPVRARMVEAPGDWDWSSYRATAGLAKTPPWLHTASVLDRFDQWDRANAAAHYRQFVATAIGSSESPWTSLRAGLYLGGEAFMQRVRQLTVDRTWRRDHLKLQQDVRAVEIGRVRAAVEGYFATSLGARTWRNERARMAFALLARTESIALLPSIGAHLDISGSAVSRMIKRAEHLNATSNDFARAVRDVQLRISRAQRSPWTESE